jgi:hypothetical protein
LGFSKAWICAYEWIESPHRGHLLGAKTWQKLLEALKKPSIVWSETHSCPREKFYKVWYIACLHYWNCVRKNLLTNVWEYYLFALEEVWPRKIFWKKHQIFFERLRQHKWRHLLMVFHAIIFYMLILFLAIWLVDT